MINLYHSYLKIIQEGIHSHEIDKEIFGRDIRKGKNDLKTKNIVVDYNLDKDVWAKYINSGNIEGVRNYLKRGFDPSVHSNYAIRMASMHGYTEIVKLLLADDRVDPTTNKNYTGTEMSANNEPIIIAAAHGNFDIVMLLLKINTVEPSSKDNFVFMKAAESGRMDVLRAIIEHPKFTFDNKIDALDFAIFGGYTETVKLLLSYPEIENMISVSDNKYLFNASAKSFPEIVKLLISNSKFSFTERVNDIVFRAAQREDNEIVKLFVSNDKIMNNINQKTKQELIEAGYL